MEGMKREKGYAVPNQDRTTWEPFQVPTAALPEACHVPSPSPSAGDAVGSSPIAWVKRPAQFMPPGSGGSTADSGGLGP